MSPTTQTSLSIELVNDAGYFLFLPYYETVLLYPKILHISKVKNTVNAITYHKTLIN